MAEEWRRIEGWPYEVSDLGRVRRLYSGRRRRLPPRQLKLKVHTNGYLYLTLCNAGDQKGAFVHRLVCRAFHGAAPEGCPEVDHLNSRRADNRAENLRWCSVRENRLKRDVCRGSRHANSKLTEEQVETILRRATSPAMDRVIAAEFQMSREQIRDIRLRKMWRHVHA